MNAADTAAASLSQTLSELATERAAATALAEEGDRREGEQVFTPPPPASCCT